MNGTAYDTNNNPIKCDKDNCQEEASYIVMGENITIARCDKHGPYAHDKDYFK